MMTIRNLNSFQVPSSYTIKIKDLSAILLNGGHHIVLVDVHIDESEE